MKVQLAMPKTITQWVKEAYTTVKNNGFHESDTDPKDKLGVYLVNNPYLKVGACAKKTNPFLLIKLKYCTRRFLPKKFGKNKQII